MYISCRFACAAVVRVFESVRMLLVCRKGCVGEKVRWWCVTKKDEKGQNKMAAGHMGGKMVMLII